MGLSNREKNQFKATFPVAATSQLREKQSPDWAVKATAIPSPCTPAPASEATDGGTENHAHAAAGLMPTQTRAG